MRFRLLFLFLLGGFHSLTQDIQYARRVVELLTDQGMHGRGYVKDGHKIAANFIASEFEHFGLQSFSLDYQQPFPLKVNTFPGKLKLQIDDKKLEPGSDFLVDPSSPSVKGKFEILRLDLDTLLSNTKEWVKIIKTTDKAILFDKTGTEDLPSEDQVIINQLSEVFKFNKELNAPVYIEVSSDKLTWGTSSELTPRTILRIKNSSVDSLNTKRTKLNIQNKYLTNYYSQNVIGLIEGERTDSVIMVTAHYDHLGRMGSKTFFPGANDNASGVAMLLNIARHFSFSEKPPFSMVFIAFGGEEAGLLGSQYYRDRPLYPLERVKFLLNLDIVGTGDEGITVVNGKVYQKQFELLSNLNEGLIPEIKPRGAACNSDHCPFDQVGVPNFFIYTRGGIQAYHDIYDKGNTLPLTKFEELFALIVNFLKEV